MKKIITLILSVFVLSVSGQNYKEIIKNVSDKQYPDASALNIYTKVDITLNADGSFSKHYYYIKKILTYKGKTKYSDVKISYNKNFETIKLGECFSVRDNKKIPLPKEATHDNATYMTMYSPEYINQWQTVVNLPAIEPGDYVVMDYTIESKPHSYFSGKEHFQEENPYLHKEMHITVPEKQPLYYRFAEDKIKFSKQTEKGKTTYSWTANNVPLIKDEKNKPSYLIIGQPVLYASVESWNDAIPLLFKQFKSVNYNSDELKKLLPDLANSKANDQVKLQGIYTYIHNNFSFKYAMNDDKYIPQPIDLVLKQRYGSSRELVALFITMAKNAGVQNVKPVFVVSQTKAKETKTFPYRNFISGLYAYYNGQLLSFSQKDMRYGFAWFEDAYLFTDDTPVKMIEYQFDTKNLVNKTVTISLNKDFSGDANFTKELRGKKDYRIRSQFKDETEKNRKIWFSQSISNKSITIIGEPEFIDIKNYEANLKIKFAANIDDFYTMQDSYLYLQLPETENVDLKMTGKERETPYQIYNTISVTEKYVFDNIPDGYTLIKPKNPISQSFKSGNDEMSFSVSATMGNNQLIVYRKIYIPSTIVSKADYPALYKFISTIQKPLNTVIFLKK
ncbi:MAG: DUF3857 and transglutaminase domain-containing protein [Bacteroidales bacterium]|nr:DUF3857 and transglutaminase domain-containing protein [Bacteroidales bacterium]